MKTPIKSMLCFTNAQKILDFLLQKPSGKFYDREVANLTGVSPAGTNFSLRDLAKAGLANKETKGKMNFYSVDPQDPLIQQLKVVQNIVFLKPLIEAIKNDCLRIILFGSSAKGTNQEESDCDLFVLSRDKEKVQESIVKYGSPLKIQPILHTPQEWVKIEKTNEVLANQIEKGIVLWESHES